MSDVIAEIDIQLLESLNEEVMCESTSSYCEEEGPHAANWYVRVIPHCVKVDCPTIQAWCQETIDVLEEFKDNMVGCAACGARKIGPLKDQWHKIEKIKK